MSVRVACVKCNKTFTLKDEFAGRKIRCPECQNVIQVPGLPASSAATPAASKPSAATTGAAAPARPAAPVRTEPSSGRPQRSSTVIQNNRAGAGKFDSEATATFQSRPSPASDSTSVPGVPGKAGQNACPSCGRSVPADAQACPFCRYHFKLRRKIGLSVAIHSANMHSQGLNSDGSKKITRADIAEDRVEEQKKVGKTMKIASLALLGVIALAVYLFLHFAMQDFTVDDMRHLGKLPALKAENPDTYNPLWISLSPAESISVTIPVNEIYTEKTVFVSPWPAGTPAWAAFAQAVKAPLATTKARLSAEGARPLIAQADSLGGTYSPKALQERAPALEVTVWRRAPTPQESGYLRGAILDFGKEDFRANEISAARQELADNIAKREKKIKELIASQEAFGKVMTQEQAEKEFPAPKVPLVEITGRLNMLPFLDYDLNGNQFSYRFSAENGSPNVRKPEDVSPVAEKDRRQENACYFAPVILVQTVQVVQPANKKRQ